MEGVDERELQLLPATHNSNRHSRPSSSRSLIPASWPSPINESSPSKKLMKSSSLTRRPITPAKPAGFSFHGSSLDLQLSITVPTPKRLDVKEGGGGAACSSLETLRWQAAENIRLAAMEKAYAERVREMTRREMELAQSEFARARHVWERAREDVERAEKLMKEKVTRTCMEITCQSCRRKFRP